MPCQDFTDSSGFDSKMCIHHPTVLLFEDDVDNHAGLERSTPSTERFLHSIALGQRKS